MPASRPPPRLPLRLLLLAVLAVAAAAVLGLLIGTLNGVLELYARVAALPAWVRLPLLTALAAIFAAGGLLAWRLLRPARRPPAGALPAPDRSTVEARLDRLRERAVDTAELERELLELDRRRAAGDCHVALFGEISTGKSSLVRALAPEAAVEVDVRGGTTRAVSHHRGRLDDGRELVIADVPGSGEVGGALHEQLARDESLRAHALVYVCAGDLTRAQDAELTWLAGFGKPLVLVLNKLDRYTDEERDALAHALAGRYAGRASAVVGASAGGLERFERALPDGRIERVERERHAAIEPLRAALTRLTAVGIDVLEPARAAAVLGGVAARAGALDREAAAAASEATVTRYTRRAVVGALAAVAPGTDLVIQGALATAMLRELARIHDVPARELDLEALLGRLRLTVRNTSAIVLAIAGNALKAFPGLGTLGGGVLHAIAYGLVFDSVGRAVTATLAERVELDQADAERRLRELLAEPGRERIERVARIVLDSVRGRDAQRPDG